MSCRLFDGEVKRGDRIELMSMGTEYEVEEVGVFRLERIEKEALSAGEVGYIIAGIKTVSDTRIGDTVTNTEHPAEKPLPGFKQVKPVVFSSIYPIDADDNSALGDALERYTLNDAALAYQRDTSVALGHGFRCGFLGLLHMEIFQERLEREFGQSIVMTAPSVRYRFVMDGGETVEVDNPEYYPDPARIDHALEPFISAIIIIPERYMGVVMKLCLARRGVSSHFSYPVPGRMELLFEMPLAEVIYDFYDKLKNITQGYGSFDYEMLDYRRTKLAKLDILVNGDKVDALSVIVHEERARTRAVEVCERLKEEIPRHLFKIAIQGAIGGKIIARTNVSAMRKDVTAKCYGGDITRKRKLLEKQAKGKRRMKMVGKIMIPQSAFVTVLKTKDE